MKRSTTERGYGTAHQRTRARVAKDVAAGRAVCCRCGRPILDGEAWDLDHTDDRRGYLGPAHASENRAAGARKGNRRRRRLPSDDATDLRW